MAEGLDKMKQLQEGGFSRDEIRQWELQTRKELSDGGFANDEIDEYFGIKKPNMAPAQKHFDETRAQLIVPPEVQAERDQKRYEILQDELKSNPQDQALKKEIAFEEEKRSKLKTEPQVSQPAIPAEGMPKAEAAEKPKTVPAKQPEKADNAETWAQWVERVWGVSASAVKSGFQASVTGLMMHGALPDETLAQDAPWYARIGYQLGMIGGDAPWMLPGAVLGGAAGGTAGSAVPVVGTAGGALVGGGAGALMLPESMRTLLMQGYEKGEVQSFGDFFDRAAALFINTAKSGIVGGLTGPAGPVAGKLLGPAAGPILRNTAETAAAIGTMVTVGKALEGQVPKASDFLDAAVVIGGLKGSMAVAAKLRTIYAKTGAKPEQVVEDAQNEPSIKQDLLSDNKEIPGKYEPRLTEAEPVKVVAKPMTPEEQAAYDAAHPEEAEPTATAEGGGPNEPRLPEELPRPPESPEPGMAQQAVLDRIVPSPDKPRFSWSQLYTNVVNDLHPLFEATKAMGGEDLPAAEHPGKLAQMTRGVFGKADQFLSYGTFDFKTYETTGKGLKEILAPFKDDLDGVRAYAAARRAVELEGRGIPTGFPMEQARDVVEQGNKTYGKAFDELQKYQRSLTAYLRDSGVLSKDGYDAMLEANQNYVPFFRLMDEPQKVAGKGLTTRNPVKGIKGSERQIIDPIESIIKNTYLYMALAERNAVGKVFVELVEKSPDGASFGQKVTRPSRPIELGSGEVDRLLKQYDVQTDSPESFSIFRPGVLTPKANEIVVFREGKPELWEVDKDVAAAFKATDKETAPWLLKMLRIPASALRAGATLTPDFMVKNYSRDQLSAFAFTKNGYIPVLDFMRGVGSLVKKDDSFQNWLKSGGANAAMVSVDRDYIQQNILKLDSETGLASRAWNVVKSPLEVLRVASELVENATRLGEFKQATKSDTSKQAIQEGGFSSREVTLDFARIGAKTQAMNMITAFFNANIQGVDRAVRAFGENPIGTSAKIAASITLPSVMLWWANHDDPRYKEIPQWEKDIFWIVMTKDHIFRIPKPFELGVMFGSVPERTLDAFADQNPRAFQALSKSMANAFLPGFMPTAATPILEQATNYSFFRNAPLVSSRAEKLLPEYQYNDYTSEFTKSIGRLVGSFPGMHDSSAASPAVIDNYVRQWTGGTGTYAMQIADAALRKAGVLPDPVRPAATLADIPVVKAFMVRYPSAQAQSIQDFDERSKKAEMTVNTIKFLAQQGDFESSLKEMTIGEDTMLRLNGMQQALATQNKMIHMINQNPNVTPEEKRQLIDSIYYQMIEISRTGNDMLDRVDKQLKQAHKEAEAVQ